MFYWYLVPIEHFDVVKLDSAGKSGKILQKVDKGGRILSLPPFCLFPCG